VGRGEKLRAIPLDYTKKKENAQRSYQGASFKGKMRLSTVRRTTTDKKEKVTPLKKLEKNKKERTCCGLARAGRGISTGGRAFLLTGVKDTHTTHG